MMTATVISNLVTYYNYKNPESLIDSGFFFINIIRVIKMSMITIIGL